MIVLGIETSCDDTGIGIYNFKTHKVLSHVLSSQHEIHKKFLGVVPEYAARAHLEVIDVLFDYALKEANLRPKDIDLICVTNRPGLIGSLFVGLMFAKGLCLALEKPLKAVDHLEAHIFSPFIGFKKEDIPFPFLSIVVSGGHTHFYLVEDIGKYTLVAKTLDDALGEAFDKVGSHILGLGFPGGPYIDKIFQSYKGEYISFTYPKVKKNPFNLSFSGFKTQAIKYHNQGADKMKLAASFQKYTIDYLISKIEKILKHYKINALAISGGVSANSYFRKKILNLKDVKVYMPDLKYTSDNGVMVAYIGGFLFEKYGEDPIDINAYSYSPLQQFNQIYN